jgi:AcrR family transcriptional regulator
MPRPKNKPRRLGRPPASTSEETRQRIVEAAEKCFSLRGYDKTTNKDIAEEAGLTTGALYHYFESKQSLYLAVLTDRQKLVLARFTEVAAAQTTAVDKLSAVLDSAADLNAEYPYIASFLSTAALEVLRHDEFSDRRVTPVSHSGGSGDFFTEIVIQGVRDGEFGPGANVSDIVNMLQAVTSGMAQYAAFLHDPVAHRRLINAFQGLLRGTLIPAAKTKAGRTGDARALGPRRRARVS